MRSRAIQLVVKEINVSELGSEDRLEAMKEVCVRAARRGRAHAPGQDGRCRAEAARHRRWTC